MELEGIPLHETIGRVVHPVHELSLHLFPERDMAITFVPEPAPESGVRTEWIDHRQADLLRACDGRRALGEIAGSLMAGGWTLDEVFGQLSRSLERGYLSFTPRDESAPPRVTGSRTRDLPVHLTVECTSRCNLRCAHCYLSAEPGAGADFPVPRLFDVLGEFERIGVRTVELTGGEPLGHPRWDEILEYALDHFAQVAVLTNGTLLDRERARRLGARPGRVIVGVSIDGASAEAHDRRRGVPGSFDRTLAGMRLLREAGVPFRASMSVYPDSFDEIEPVMDLTRAVGARWFSYNAASPIGRGSALSWNGWEEPRRRFAELEPRLQQKHHGFLALIPPERMREIQQEGCGAARRTLALGANGDVRPCVLMPLDRGVLGNVLRRPVDEVLESPRGAAFRSLPPPAASLCGDCHYRYYCLNCPAKALVLSADGRQDCRWAESLRPEIARLSA